MAGKAERYMGEMVAENHTLAFVGPHAMPGLPVLDKAMFAGAAGNLIASFPDLTFNFTKETPKQNADGSWSADIVVMGTHTGAPFSPMPGKLPAIDKTDICVKIGPETFTLWVDADGKVCKTEITPLGAGHPHGPPGFYLGIGGKIPEPPKDYIMMAEVKDFDDWFAGFKQHATETTFTIGGKAYTVSMTRGAACDESKTEVFYDVDNKNKIVILMYALDMAKMGVLMQEPAFKEMSEKAIVSQSPPAFISDPGPPSGDATGPPSMFFCTEVADPDKWIAGFKAHATSKTGTWGYEVPITRAEFVNEEKTRVFKSAMRPSVVGGFMEEVRMEKLGPVLSDEKFQQLTKDLGEKTETKVMKVVTPMPPPPADAYPVGK